MIAATMRVQQPTQAAVTSSATPTRPSGSSAGPGGAAPDGYDPTPAPDPDGAAGQLADLLARRSAELRRISPPRQSDTERREERLAEIDRHRPTAKELEGVSWVEWIRIHARYARERSADYARLATELETDPAADPDQLERAQQGAKPHRIDAMERELEQTTVGRRVLEYHRRQGTKLTVLTDREWKQAGHDDGVLAFANHGGVTMRASQMTAQIFVHEMTHTIDDRERTFSNGWLDRMNGTGVRFVRARYEAAGLDPDEGQAAWEIAHDAKSYGPHVQTHAHTRMAEARLQRERNGGPDLTLDEMREVMRLSLPRENLIAVRAALQDDDRSNDAEMLRAAQDLGIEVEGRSIEDVTADLAARADELERRIVAIEQRR